MRAVTLGYFVSLSLLLTIYLIHTLSMEEKSLIAVTLLRRKRICSVIGFDWGISFDSPAGSRIPLDVWGDESTCHNPM